ncbi:MAG: hypothetical protein JRJ47_13180 [Deltaproteobacteria bacterium]|nr:hypothetical protein [Deltaproteobacteria bacterium]
MRKSFYIAIVPILLSVWLQACATAVEPSCRHMALYQAITFRDLTGAPVRIAIGPSDKGLHAQAQAKVNSEWEWLEQGKFGVGTGYKDMVPGFEPDRYSSVEDFLKYFGYRVTRSIEVAKRADNEVPAASGYSSSQTIYRRPR